MAQSRKRRSTKHRGNAAGMVETRGRTGRRVEASEKKVDPKVAARQKRLERLDRHPTWRGAFNRAAIAAVFFGLVAWLMLDNRPAAAVALASMMLLIYIPMSYYTDLAIYRRRQKKKAQAA